MIIAGVAAIVGCASVLNIDSDRHVDDTADSSTPVDGSMMDTAAPDAGVDASSWPPGWTCLDNPVPTTPSGNVRLQLHFDDVSTNGPVVGADVHACEQLDIPCLHPFGGVITDDSGTALLTVVGGFNGYYEFDAGSFNATLLSRVPQYSDESGQQGMPDAVTISSAYQLAGVTQDTTLGTAIVSVSDCMGNTAGGVAFAVANLGAKGQLFYLKNSLPTMGETQTEAASGSALIFNVPIGTLTITASYFSTQQTLRIVSTYARQGWVTQVQIRPDQATHQPIDGG